MPYPTLQQILGLVFSDSDDTLRVKIISGGGGASTPNAEYTEGDTDASFTGIVAMTEGPSNTATPLQTNASKQLLVSVEASALPTGAATSAKQDTIIGHVDGIEASLSSIDAKLSAGATNFSKAEDAASANADVGVPSMAVRKATPANVSDTDGDYEFLQMSGGRLWTSAVIDTALPAGANVIGAVTQSGNWSVRLTDGTDTADIFDLTNSNPLAVAIVDGSGDQITSFGGGVQYTEGDVDTTITGTAILWEDAANTLAAVSASKPLPVNTELASAITADDSVAGPDTAPSYSFLMGYGSGGGSQWARLRIAADNSDNLGTSSTGHLQVIGHTYCFNGTGWDRIRGDTTNGLDVDVTRVQGTVDVTQSGAWTVTVQDGGNSITVDNNGTFAVQATIAAGATSIAKAEDEASANADVGVPAMAVRKATPANVSGTDGDYEFLQISAGRLWTSAVIDTALPTGTNSIGQVTANAGTNLNTSALALESGGNLAAAVTALQIIDDWDESDRAKVNLIVGQAGVAGGSGTVGATTLRVTLATDVALPTGANVIGAVTQSGTWVNTPVRSGNAALTNVPGSASSVQLLASTAGRLGATFHNDSTATLYLKFGTTASTSSYTAKIGPDEYYELPNPVFTGQIDGIWSSATGTVRITELT